MLNARVQKHFSTFELSPLYISQSGAELANIRTQLNNIFEKSGVDNVREHLRDSFQTHYSSHINSWQTAMYKAMVDSDWFCNGGFNSI